MKGYISLDDKGISYQEAARELGEVLNRRIDPAEFKKLEGKFGTSASLQPIILGETRFVGCSNVYSDFASDVTLRLDLPVKVNVMPRSPFLHAPFLNLEGYEAQLLIYDKKELAGHSKMQVVQRNLLGLVDMIKNPEKYSVAFGRVCYGRSD